MPRIHKVIVAAAVEALLGRRVRILWIRPVEAAPSGLWVLQSRRRGGKNT